MFLLGALIRFGRFFLIFLLLCAFAWLLWRGVSFIIRLLYDQLEDETSDWKVWLKSKLPKRKKKTVHYDISGMTNEELREIVEYIAKTMEDDVDLD